MTSTSVFAPKLSPSPTQSYWHTRNVFSPGRAGLPFLEQTVGRRHATDVAIIGAGIAGCSLAYHLTRLHPDVTVTVVDGRHLAGAATGRNGGLLWPCLNASLKKVVADSGRGAARDIMKFEQEATKQITSFLLDTPGMQELTEFSHYPDGGLILFASEEEARNELGDLALAHELGFGHDLVAWGADEANRRLGARPGCYHGAIQMPGVGRLWAARLTLGLALEAARHAAATARRGAHPPSSRLALMESAEVVLVEDLPHAEVPHVPSSLPSPVSPSSVSSPHFSHTGLDRPRSLCVRTSRGDAIDCRAVVYCTNAYTAGLLPELQGKLVPVRNQVVVTSALPPAQRIPLEASVYCREGYVYWSPRADGRLVLGGFRDVLAHKEEGTFDDGSLDPEVSHSIRTYLPQHFPDLFTHAEAVQFEMEWSGILGFTKDRFPLVGALPPTVPAGGANKADRAGQYICAGFSGHGMTRAYSCAEGLARSLLGVPQGAAALPAAFSTEGRL